MGTVASATSILSSAGLVVVATPSIFYSEEATAISAAPAAPPYAPPGGPPAEPPPLFPPHPSAPEADIALRAVGLAVGCSALAVMLVLCLFAYLRRRECHWCSPFLVRSRRGVGVPVAALDRVGDLSGATATAALPSAANPSPPSPPLPPPILTKMASLQLDAWFAAKRAKDFAKPPARGQGPGARGVDAHLRSASSRPPQLRSPQLRSPQLRWAFPAQMRSRVKWASPNEPNEPNEPAHAEEKAERARLERDAQMSAVVEKEDVVELDVQGPQDAHGGGSLESAAPSATAVPTSVPTSELSPCPSSEESPSMAGAPAMARVQSRASSQVSAARRLRTSDGSRRRYAAAAAAAAIPIGVATAAPTAVPTSELPGALAMARILRRASSRSAPRRQQPLTSPRATRGFPCPESTAREARSETQADLKP